MFIAVVILSVALACVGAYVLGQFVFKKDDEQERRAENYLALAVVMRDMGLVDLPEILTKLAIQDYSGAYEKVRFYVQLAKANPEVVVKEFDGIFERVFMAKLKNPQSRLVMETRLAETKTVEKPETIAAPAPKA